MTIIHNVVDVMLWRITRRLCDTIGDTVGNQVRYCTSTIPACVSFNVRGNIFRVGEWWIYRLELPLLYASFQPQRLVPDASAASRALDGCCLLPCPRRLAPNDDMTPLPSLASGLPSTQEILVLSVVLPFIPAHSMHIVVLHLSLQSSSPRRCRAYAMLLALSRPLNRQTF